MCPISGKVTQILRLMSHLMNGVYHMSMAIRKVARMGNPVLRAPCRELSADEIRSDEIQRLVCDMRATMVEYAGVGLAAPQVHEAIKLAVIEVEVDTENGCATAAYAVFNPTVTVLDPTPLGNWEGCLSVPELRGYVERSAKVRIHYLDEHAQPQTLVAEGFLATVFQHELDHLEGILYVDRLADPSRFTFVQEFSRYHL